jgi:hypothetical protein
VSQMPEVTGSWPEEGAQYVPGAPMEPVQQAYPPQAPYQQQPPYQQQGYQEPQYHQAQQQYPQQDPQYPQQQYQEPQQYQEQTAPQQPVYYEEEQAAVPSEFDHLFRDSSPQERRSISARQPMVSGPGAAPSPGFQQQQAAAQAQPQQQVAQQQAPQTQATQVAPQQAASTAMFHPSQQQQGYEPAGQQPQYAGNYGGGGYDGSGGSGGSGSGNRRTPLIIGGAVVVIAALGLYFGLSGGGTPSKSTSTGKTTATSTSAASKETAQQQADAVYKLVQQARTLRGDISNEVGLLKACEISTVTPELNTTAAARASAASQVAALPVGKISGGSAVTAALQAAWQASAASDQGYAKAAADFAGGGCTASAVNADPNYRQASSDSTPSDNAKSTAASLWNSDMTKYEPSITSDDL